MKKYFSYILLSLVLISCDKDDETPPQENTNIPGTVIDTEQGAKFELTGPNVNEKISGDYVHMTAGQLLNGAFYRQIQISTSKGALNIRVNFPSSMVGKVDENLYSSHQLYEYAIPLEETSYLKSVVVEGYFPSSSFFDKKNGSGSVELYNKYTVNALLFELYGKLGMNVQGKDGNIYRLEGYFWKKNL